MDNLTAKEQTTVELLERFPGCASRTIAKRGMLENPGLWPTLEAARGSINRMTGQAGNKTKKGSPFIRDARKPGSWIEKMPEALTDFTDWRAVQFDGPMRALILSDIHVPYHSAEALTVAINYGLEHGADFILLNGDALDMFALSRFEKDPRKRNFPHELKDGIQFLEMIREAFPDAKIIFKEGNHEERYERHMMSQCVDLIGIDYFTWKSVYHLEDFDIQMIGEKRPIRLGKLTTLHGHEFAGGGSGGVSAARTFYLKAKINVLGGHYHRVSHHSETDLDGKLVTSFSVGCLSELHPKYMPLNQWAHGFAFAEIDERGAFRVENLRIIDGKAW